MHNKPQGQQTRGKTAANRLRQIDVMSLRYDQQVLTRNDGEFKQALWVDLGYGAEPVTTLESAARFRSLNPTLPILGVEISPERVALAQQFANSQTQFKVGGFNFPLEPKQKVRAIRSYNVLRQYEQDAVDEAYDLMCERLLTGGLLVEGTCNPFGQYSVTNMVRKLGKASDGRAWHIEAMIFAYRFKTPFDPIDFQTVLPKNLIHKVTQGEPIHQFFQDWKEQAHLLSHLKTWGHRQWFVGTALALKDLGYNIDTHSWWLRHGFLVWRSPGI